MLTKLEIKRQLIHIFTGLFLIYGVKHDHLDGFLIFIGFLLVALFSFMVKKGIYVPIFSRILKQLQRKYEEKGIPAQGLLFYLLGASLVCFFYSKNVALAAIIILALGDSTSRLVGPDGYVAKPWRHSRFILGILVGGIISTLAASKFVPIHHAFIAAFVAMYLETINLKWKHFRLDDNVLIPVISGFILQLLQQS